MARLTATSKKRLTCSTSRKSRTLSLPTGSAPGWRKTGTSSSAAIAKKSSAPSESRYSPRTLLFTMSPTKPPSLTVRAVSSSSSVPPKGLV